jgi:transcriptional regulator of nitric oxide reductase
MIALLITPDIAAIASVSISLFISTLAYLIDRFLIRSLKPDNRLDVISYREKIAALTRSLVESSAHVDRILKEMQEVSQQRETAIITLEQKLSELSEREKNLQEKVTMLEKVPLKAIEYFVDAVEKGEQRSAWRDYILFALGVVVSTVIAVMLKTIFGI